MNVPISTCSVLIAVMVSVTFIPYACTAGFSPFPIDPAPFGPVNPFPDFGDLQNPSPFPIDPPALDDPCPFPDIGELKDPSPFPIDPPALDDPCPFSESDTSSLQGSNSSTSSGNATEGIPQVNPTSVAEAIIVGCPFSPPPTPEPVIWGFPTDLSNPASAGAPPSDPNRDGKYEDINGNGFFEFGDVILLFKDLNWCIQHQPIEPFDFDKDGIISFHDIIDLFVKAGTQ